MSDETPQEPQPPKTTPPPVPPVTPPSTCREAIEPLETCMNPEEREPVKGVGDAIDSILRRPGRVVHHLESRGAAGLGFLFFIIAMVASLIYGFVVGSFSLGDQLWAAPVKVAGGLMVSGLICLPSLYIFSCLAGSSARGGQIVGLVLGMLALLSVLLLGFAPVAWIFSTSTGSVLSMGFLHLLFCSIAVWFAMRFLGRGFGVLEDRTGVFRVWIAIFVLVMLQMTTALRPLVGTSENFWPAEKKFFMTHWFENIDGAAKQPREEWREKQRDASLR